ncbi:MAG: adenylate/guanylate cyclase domain-containing protein [Chloroflexota bacterium]
MMGQGGSGDEERHAQDEQRSRGLLAGTEQPFRHMRRFWGRLPSQPRCKSCTRPFGGVGGAVMRGIGLGPWPMNPKYCSGCFRSIAKHRSGAEIECSLLFADVRESTPLAESLGPAQFRALMDRFFQTASEVLIERDAIVDKLKGDEVFAIFVPALAGELHALRAIEAGRRLLSATGNDTPDPWLPVGAGVNTGVAYVGTVGEGDMVDMTALGDPVNVAARLASAAGAGELLVTDAAVAAAHLSDDGLEHRSLSLKGKTERTEVVVLGPS